MTDTEQKALALVNEVAREMGLVQLRILDTDLPGERALVRAIEAHEADKKAFSDAVKHYLDQWRHSTPSREVFTCQFADFILPEPEPDPLVEARRQIADRVLRQYGAPASDEDCIGLIVAALEEQAKIERIEQ